jgi:hypothetical protein
VGLIPLFAVEVGCHKKIKSQTPEICCAFQWIDALFIGCMLMMLAVEKDF